MCSYIQEVHDVSIYNFYYDRYPIRSLETIKQEHDTAVYKYAVSDTMYELFKDLDSHTKERAYNYKKYQHCLGYCIEVLLPKTIQRNDYPAFITAVAEEILSGNKLPWIAHVVRRGMGLYVIIAFAQRKYHEKPIEIKVLREAAVYRNKVSKLWCKEDDPEAELVYEEGSVKSSYTSNWSKKVRLFEMGKEELKLFRMKIENVVRKALVKLNVMVRESNYFKAIKQYAFTNKKGKRAVYVNVNVDYYNQIIYEMNYRYNFLYETLYSPGKFYQDNETLEAFYQLMRKYKSLLGKRKFKHESGVRLSFSPYFRSDRFKENIYSFYEQFKSECLNFWGDYIWGGN